MMKVNMREMGHYAWASLHLMVYWKAELGLGKEPPRMGVSSLFWETA